MSNERILVVDDEEDILELLKVNLSREGYTVVEAALGEKAIDLVQKTPPDLIILDLMLPGLNGLEVTRLLKTDPSTRRIPIIMLTAKGEEADIVAGLELGADDYVTKPFSPRVLLARVRAVIRRKIEASAPDRDIIRIRGLRIDPKKREVIAGDTPVELTFTEFQVLHFLARRPGWVFTRSQIVDASRGDNYPVTERSVDVQVVGLRKKLGGYGDMIETVRGVGYRFREHG
jgi:two-component system phosphate regulon response regulator PhoB